MALDLPTNRTRYFQYRRKIEKIFFLHSFFALSFRSSSFFLYPLPLHSHLDRIFELDMNRFRLDSHRYAHILDDVDTRQALLKQ